MARFFDIFPRLNRRQLDRDLRRLQNERHNININANVNGGNHVNNLDDSMNDLNHTGRDSSKIFSELRLKMGAYLAITKAVRDAVKGSIETIKSYDGYITDLANAMGSNREEAEKYLITLNKQGKEIKATTSEMAESADSFVRQGKTMAETETLIKNSMILSKVAKMSSADSTDVLTTAMNSFNLTANDTISIIDKLTSVDLVSASSADGLAISLGKSAGAAKLAGVEVDKLISMLAVMKEAAPMESDEAIGNAMKSILSRINQVKAGKFIDEETGEALNDVEKVLSQLSISMRDVNGQFLSSETILDEVGQKWSSFDSVTQRAISTAIAGSYQYSRFINLMDGYSKVLEYTEVSQKSSGQALEKFGNYEESIQAKTKLLQNSLESLAYDTFGNAFYGSVLDATTGLVQFIEKTETLKIGLAGLGLVGGAKIFTLISTFIMNTAKSLTTFNSALNLLKSTSLLTADFNKLLLYTEGLNTSQLRLILSSKLLSDQQRINILTNREMSIEEAKAALSTYGLATAETGATATTVTFSAAIKGLGASIKALALAHPILTAIAATGAAVYGTVKAYDALTTSVEEANEAMDEAVSNYENTKSELENISSELEQNRKLIDELNSKGKLTYAEQGQLEELQAITKELQIQENIAKRNAEKEGREASKKTIEAFDKQYGKNYDIHKEIDIFQNNANAYGLTMLTPDEDDDIASLLVYYSEAKKLLADTYKELDNANDEDKAHLESVSQVYIDDIATIEGYLDNYLSDLDSKKSVLQESYNNAIEKQKNGENLTTDDANIIEKYKQIHEMQKAIYEYSNQTDWNDMEINNILNTQGIEKTKEELVELAKLGELTPEKIAENFPVLNKAISESELFLKNGQTVVEAFIEDINALTDDINVGDVVDITPSFPSISETIEQLSTQLQPTFDSLKDAYQDIFTLDDNGNEVFSLENVDLSMLDSIKSTIDEINENEELGIYIDYESLENLSRVLMDSESSAEDVRNSMNLLATDIVNSLNPALNQTSGENYKFVQSLLESLGIVNSEEVMIASLGYSYEDYVKAKEECEGTTLDLATATQDEIDEFVNEAIASDTCGQSLAYLEFCKRIVDEANLDTADEVSQLLTLANAAGITAGALGKLYNLQMQYESADSHDKGRIAAEIEALKSQVQSEFANVSVNFTPKHDSKDKKSGKDSSKEFDWIETAINNIESDIQRLDKVIDSAYTSAGEKSEALVEQFHKVNEEIKLQQQAYEGYMAKANSINLSDKYKQLVQSGAIDIEKITDEKLQTAISDYQQWYEKAKETQDKINDLYEQSNDIHVESYEFEADQLAKFRDKNLLNMAEYYESMMNLQDQYYNREALKLKDLADKMEAEYGRMSNINLTRPTVDVTAMQQAGYIPTVESSSVHAMTFGNEDKQVIVTPILPDGTILSPEALTNYANMLLSGQKIDTNIQLAMFDGKDADKQASEYVKGLENIQGEYAKLKETFADNPYGDLTEKELEAIEKLSEELDKVKSDLSSELGDIKSAYDNLIEIRDTYNEHGKISVDQYQNLCDMGFQYLALLSNEAGALSLDEEAFQRLANAKIQEMQVTMALQAVDLINNIETEADAVKYLAASYGNLANEALNAAEQMLRAALIKTELEYGADSKQYQAAQTIVKGYENSKLLAGVVDIKMQSGGGYKDKDNSETKDWAERLLENIDKGLEKTAKVVEKISDKTDKLIDKVDKFFSWQKKNAMINRAVKSTDKEIKANKEQISDIANAIKRVKSVVNLYTKKLSEIELPDEYKNKIQNGTLEIEEIGSSSLQKTIKEYEEWYGKIEDCKEKMEDYEESIEECRNSISDLYDQQRDLIRQKLDNVLDYYSDMDSYLTSITSKMESLVSLNDAMGKRSSLTELVEQFAEANDRLSATVEKSLEKSITEIDLGDSESVKKAQAEDRQELIDAIRSEISNLDVDQSGTYTKLLKNIAKTEAKIQKYEDKGWDVKKAKAYDKLLVKLQNYYDLQSELDANATSDTITNYSRIYTAWQKLQNKIDDGKTLSKSQQKKYDSYLEQMEQLKSDKDDILAELETELGIAKGEITTSEADKARKELNDVADNLENSATYKKLLSDIEKTEEKIAVLDEKGYDNLSKSQKKTYDKLLATLEDYYERKEALDEGATASNVAQYNKIYVAWRKLQDKLDAGKNLSTSDWKKYNTYTEQLKEFKDSKDELVGDLQTQLDEVLNPADKIGTIDREYEKAAEDMYQSYQDQIDAINNEVTDTTQYQNLLAKAQKLEQKKDTKGLSKSEQAKLDKYNAELEALREGGNAANIADYMSTWEKWYNLEQKFIKDGKLSDSNAKKYDEYKAKLEAWNKEKQTQINDLVSLMEDDLDALQKTYTENVTEAESQIDEYYANLYDLAKQIAEYNLSTLETQLSYLEAYINYYKELVSLYDTFSDDKLAKIMSDLDMGAVEGQEQLYNEYLVKLQEKYDTTLKKIEEYNELIDAIDMNDFEGSMELFKNAIDEYTKNGQTDMANKLQTVLDLLNERAVDADNWDESADLWLNEWEEALASAKTELIGIATNIQEVNDALREIKFSNITNAIQKLNDAQDILSSISDLINDDWLYDTDGNLTQHGVTKVGLLVEEMNSAKQEVSKYAQLMKSIQEMQNTYASDEAYQTALQEAKMNYLTSLNDLQNYQDSVVAILTRADESIINSLKDVIAKRKEALQKKKELYDYGKTIESSQKEIDAIQVQIDALKSLSGAMDSATKAKLAQLEADLAEKQEALQETKDDHTYNLQIDALDEFLANLDSTMSDTVDSVNKSFESYVDAINSALEVYNQNKDYLDKWSDKIIKTTVGLGGDSFDNVGLKIDGLTDSNENVETPDFAIVNSDTVNAIESTSATTNDRLGNIQSMLQSAVNSGMLVRVADSPLLTVNPDMMNFLGTYIPPMAVNVNQHLPQIASRGNQVVINNHYDCLLNVEGNVDKSVAKLLPSQLEEAYKYTTKKLHRELNVLK